MATTVTAVCRTVTPDQRFALGSAEAEHGDADAVVVAVSVASEWADSISASEISAR